MLSADALFILCKIYNAHGVYLWKIIFSFYYIKFMLLFGIDFNFAIWYARVSKL